MLTFQNLGKMGQSISETPASQIITCQLFFKIQLSRLTNFTIVFLHPVVVPPPPKKKAYTGTEINSTKAKEVLLKCIYQVERQLKKKKRRLEKSTSL